MQSWQLQGAACCGITRGLHRECSGGAHEVAFSLKIAPSDFCVNEVSIGGIVADVSATPPCDETEPPDAPGHAELGSEAAFVSGDYPGCSSENAHLSTPTNTSDTTSVTASAESGLDTLHCCFADRTEWSRAHAQLSDIASAFFSNPKPHGLFAPQLLLLSNAARVDKLLRKRAYNLVRALFPFVSLTTPSPPG